MEELECATTECGSDVYAGAVEEGGVFSADVGVFGFFLDVCADGCEGEVERGGVFWDVVEALEGEFYFFELGFGIRQGSVDDTCLEVVSEEAGVEDEHGHEGGNAELADFEYVVAEVLGFVELELCPVGLEADGAACFVGYPIEVGEAPELVREQGFELFRIGHSGYFSAVADSALCID